jgi:hypothetical protein
MGVSGQRHAPAALCPGERIPGTHCTGGCVGLRAGLDTDVRGKNPLPLPWIEPRSPGRPAVVRHTILPELTRLLSLVNKKRNFHINALNILFCRSALEQKKL